MKQIEFERETNFYDQTVAAAEAIRMRLPVQGWTAEFGCILGSGLGDLADRVEHAISIPFADIPFFPQSTVVGHAGELVCGEFAGKRVVILKGRFHYYEGHSMRTVAMPVYVLRHLGAHSLLVTNAAGGLNRNFRAGDLMAITDHLNLTGDHPLIGANDDRLGVRFPDMSVAYDREYLQHVKACAASIFNDEQQSADTRLVAGVYAGISGPAYMTPAELRMLSICGGDAVGMSTVAEVIAARHVGLRVLGISCITDMAVPDQLEPLSHEQVVRVANRTKPAFARLIETFLRTC